MRTYVFLNGLVRMEVRADDEAEADRELERILNEIEANYQVHIAASDCELEYFY